MGAVLFLKVALKDKLIFEVDLMSHNRDLTNQMYYIVGSLLFGSLLAIIIFYVNVIVYDVPTGPLMFFMIAVPSTATIFASFALFRVANQEERNKARQSHQILEITRKTVPYLRKGLSFESAQDVSQIIYEEVDAVAVSITDTTTVLGFYGLGDDHHQQGRPILTRSTREALATNTTQIVASKAEIGCPMVTCKLKAAIVVPLQKLGKPTGVLKFYYNNPSKLTESRIAVAEGLAQLLSTQIELSELEKQKELAYQAELRALQAQINPHFLFNTLNTITSFVRTDPQKARKLLIQFSNFFRKSLEWKGGFITLAQELDYITNYLVLEKARFGDRLKIDFDIESSTQNCILPALSVQPLVENAIKHGFSNKDKLEVSIIAKLAGGDLRVIVADNGGGISDEDLDRVLKFGYGKGSGIGLSNVNERLRSLYGEDYQVKIESTIGAGTHVFLRFPIIRSKEENEAENVNSR